VPYRRHLCASCYRKGLRAKNPERSREQNRQNYQRHREARIAWQKEYHRRHRDERLAYMKTWAALNREHLRTYHREYRVSDAGGAVRMRTMASTYVGRYRRNHPEAADAHRARQAARRAKGAQVEIVTMAQALFDADGLCHLCGHIIADAGEAELDHVVPLICGGLHIRSNIAAAHSRCNRIKRGLHPDEIPQHITSRFHKAAAKHTHYIPPPNWPMGEG
jgi:5-methylcytosine-specific restriction endonuclease McrA